MAYQYNRPAAYLLDPAQGPFVVPIHTLSLPAHWEEPLLRLCRGGMTEAQAERRRRVPTAAVNQLMRATAPDIVTVDSTARFGSENPWLYCEGAYPMAVTNLYIATWIKSLPHDADDPETTALLMNCFRDLDTAALSWRPGEVDLLEQKVSPGGTALPAPHVYRLLPDVLAERIARQGPYEHHGQQLSFRQVAGRTGARGQGSGGAELMSDVIEYVPRRRGGGDGRPAYYAATLRITVRTVPFSPVPRVHVAASVRRFVTGKVYMPYGNGVSAYLLPDDSLVHDGPQPQRFAVAMLEWKNGTTDWRQGGAEGMLARISALDALPSPDRLVKEADHWIHSRDGIRIAIGHQAAMGRHTIGTGLMPSERRRLIEWAEQAIAPEFVPVPKLERSTYARPPRKQLKKLPSIPKKEQPPEDFADILNKREHGLANNAQVVRAHLAEALEGEDLTAVVLHQSDTMRDQLIAAAEAGLGLAGHRCQQGPDIWIWEAEELTVRLHAQPLGNLGAPLGGDSVPRRGKEHDKAIEERRIDVARAMNALRVTAPGARLAFVELDGEEAFRHVKRRSDPKHAIRLGCADAGMVTQFIRPLDPEMETEEEAVADARLRAAAAWSDGLRQTGMRLVPQHTLGDDLIPVNLNQVAFHLVERRHDGPTGKRQFTPIAILIRPGAKCVLGRSPDVQGWVAYPELLKGLTGRVRGEELRTSAQQSAYTAAFIKKTLLRLRGTPTLVLAHAQDIRKRWSWLKNDGLERDKLGVDGGPAQRIGLYGKQLRVVRIADGSRDETAQCWAEREELDPGLEGRQRGGIAKGLWRSAVRGDTDRVFYSTADKPSTQTKLTNDDAKLTPHVNAGGKNAYRPTANAWNPAPLELTVACLQPGDDAEAWAAYVHQQRFCEDYRDALGLPLILHLAQLADHYALPHEVEDAVDPSESSGSVPTDEYAPNQLAFDLDVDVDDADNA